jgi:hypothetical protein
MVIPVLPQNAAQYISRYEPYALKWNREEALRLVVWVLTKARILEQSVIEPITPLTEDDTANELEILWGLKLGSKKSREARSIEWVFAALSDFNNQIQSRDLMRLLNLSAQKSVQDGHWNDRILTPTALKSSLPECGQNKIKELGDENKVLEPIFLKLQNTHQDYRKDPLVIEQLELTNLDVKALAEAGLIKQYEGKYIMAPIFRNGLGFTWAESSRPPFLRGFKI